jgi:flavodoxin
MDVLVVYESKHDRTRLVVDAIAEAAASHHVATLVRTIDEATPALVASSDVVIAGCTTPGDTPFGGKPTRRMGAWIDGLDPLGGKRVGVYCAYNFWPHTFADTTTRVAETLRVLGDKFELKGATVEATQGINIKSAERGSAALIENLLPETVDR